MKNYLAGAVLLVGVQVAVANAGVNVDINIGNPRPVVVVPAQPPPPRFVVREAPRFIFSPPLGFFVSVGSPYDIVYIGDSYYLNSGGYWYNAPYYDGPWVVVGPRRLPPGLRNHRFEEIRRYRDFENRNFERDREHYRGRWYTPERRRIEERHAQRREEHRDEHRDDRRDDLRDRR